MLDVVDHLLDELLVDVLVDDRLGGRRTRLAGDAEAAARDDVHGFVHVGAGHHDGRILPAHLQLHTLPVVDRLLADLLTDRWLPVNETASTSGLEDGGPDTPRAR